MIEAAHPKAHRTITNLLGKGCFAAFRANRGWLNSKFQTVCDDEGRPIAMPLSAGKVDDHKGASFVIAALSPAKTLFANRGNDEPRFRPALTAIGIAPCTTSNRTRKNPSPWDKALCRRRQLHRSATGTSRRMVANCPRNAAALGLLR
ncbi:hypothetical protein AB4Z10_08940 [Bosea sp. RAF48]|uniref:hypothetical protein n=1 Tax=Bosea sp. RAF48 TaxID=3237480 RepID=UPI003F8E3F04